MDGKQIRIKIKDGYLVAGRNSDPDYDGIYIVFETNEGDIIDVALTECKTENDMKKIDVYTYEDVYTDNWTRKYTLDTDEINKVLNSEK